MRLGHAQAYATQQGPLDLVVARSSRAEPRRGQRYEGRLSVKGDLLSITPQELLLDFGPLTS